MQCAGTARPARVHTLQKFLFCWQKEGRRKTAFIPADTLEKEKKRIIRKG